MWSRSPASMVTSNAYAHTWLTWLAAIAMEQVLPVAWVDIVFFPLNRSQCCFLICALVYRILTWLTDSPKARCCKGTVGWLEVWWEMCTSCCNALSISPEAPLQTDWRWEKGGDGVRASCAMQFDDCAMLCPQADLSQCSSAPQALPAPDTSPYFTRMHCTQAVQEIGCNRFVVILRKKKKTVWNQHICLSYGMVRWESPHLLSWVNCTDCAFKGDEGQNKTISLTSQRQVCWQESRKNCTTARQRRNVAMIILK